MTFSGNAAPAQVSVLFPCFVMTKQWDMPSEFNDTLYNLAYQGHLKNMAGVSNAPDVSDGVLRYISHKRSNILVDEKHPFMLEFARMVDATVREYLSSVYGYQHDGEISMMADGFYQRSEGEDAAGIPAHTHQRADLVVTYYPRVVMGESEPANLFKRGALRFYDPSGLGQRRWRNRNPSFFCDGQFVTEPKTGTMVVFEGNMLHDSSHFAGVDRMCIPVICNVLTEKAFTGVTMSAIEAAQNG